jgi:hypothetical protein
MAQIALDPLQKYIDALDEIYTLCLKHHGDGPWGMDFPYHDKPEKEKMLSLIKSKYSEFHNIVTKTTSEVSHTTKPKHPIDPDVFNPLDVAGRDAYLQEHFNDVDEVGTVSVRMSWIGPK